MTTLRTALCVCVGALVCRAPAPAAAQTNVRATPGHDTPWRQYGDWTASRIGGGGYVLGTRFTSDPDRLYAWTDVGGAHRSDDGGETWTNITWTLPYGGTTESRGMMYCRDLLADPEDPDRALIAIGYHWSPTFGIYRTHDAGASWDRVAEAWFCGDDETRYQGSVLDRSDSEPRTIWAASVNGPALVSRDKGESWQEVGGPKVAPTDVLVDATDPDRVWIAAEALDVWVSPEHANNAENNKLVTPGGLWRTDDGGKSWVGLLADEDVANLVQDPDDPSRLFAIRHRRTSVEVSTDGGETWAPVMEGLNPPFDGGQDVRDRSVYANFSEDGDTLYLASMNVDLFRLAGSGDAWERVGSGLDGVEEPEDWWGGVQGQPVYGSDYVNTMSAVSSIEVSPHDPDELAMTDWYSVYRSYDAGQTWKNMTEGIEATYIDAVEQDPSDPGVVHLGMADIGYFKSTDGGRTFVCRSHTAAITNNIKSINSPASDPSRVYATGPVPNTAGWYAGQPFVSHDAGETWEASPRTGLPEIGADAARAHTIEVVDDEPDTAYLTVSCPDGMNGGGLYVSRDAAETWTLDSEGLPTGVRFFRYVPWGGGHELAVAPNRTLLANSIENGLLYRRAEGETSFARVPMPVPGAAFNDVQADPHAAKDGPGRFYAAGPDAGLFRSDDDGRTWEKLDTPAAAPGPKQLILDRVVPGRVAVGTSFGVILSEDAGDTWAVLDQRLPGRVDWNKGCFAGDRLVVGSGGAGVYFLDLGPDGSR